MRYAIAGALGLVMILLVEETQSWFLMWLVYLLLILVFLALRITAKPAKMRSITRRLSTDYAHAGEPVTVSVSVDWQARRGLGWVLLEDRPNARINPLSSNGGG